LSIPALIVELIIGGALLASGYALFVVWQVFRGG
jgi:hypothetical protein